MKVRNQNRRWMHAAIAAASLAFPTLLAMPSASADYPEPLARLGRTFGVCWGDGYHACADSGIRLGADLPPRSYASTYGDQRQTLRESVTHRIGPTFYDRFDAANQSGCDTVVGNDLSSSPMTSQWLLEGPTTPPAAESPATESPAAESPVTEAPVTEAPVTESPAAEPPATESPAAEPPATEPPAAEPPATEPPATEIPATEIPATKSPVTETPVESAPVDRSLTEPELVPPAMSRIRVDDAEPKRRPPIASTKMSAPPNDSTEASPTNTDAVPVRTAAPRPAAPSVTRIDGPMTMRDVDSTIKTTVTPELNRFVHPGHTPEIQSKPVVAFSPQATGTPAAFDVPSPEIAIAQTVDRQPEVARPIRMSTFAVKKSASTEVTVEQSTPAVAIDSIAKDQPAAVRPTRMSTFPVNNAKSTPVLRISSGRDGAVPESLDGLYR